MVGDRVLRVGVIGLGRMGMALACRLRALGVPVSAFNRSTHRARRLVAAGGELVSDAEAPSFWVLADPDGNKVCLCTWQNRD